MQREQQGRKCIPGQCLSANRKEGQREARTKAPLLEDKRRCAGSGGGSGSTSYSERTLGEGVL